MVLLSKYRKKRPLNRQDDGKRDSTLVVIATEGRCTEKHYFEMFRSSRVHIQVLETTDTHSSPKYVLQRLRRFEKEVDLGKGDILCLVLDVDRWPKVNLKRVCHDGQDRNYILAISNPCFEVWLLSHFQDLGEGPGQETLCKAYEKKLRETLGHYNKSNLDVTQFSPENIHQAALRCQKADINPTDRWPREVGSHVYRIIEEFQKRGVKAHAK